MRLTESTVRSIIDLALALAWTDKTISSSEVHALVSFLQTEVPSEERLAATMHWLDERLREDIVIDAALEAVVRDLESDPRILLILIPFLLRLLSMDGLEPAEIASLRAVLSAFPMDERIRDLCEWYFTHAGRTWDVPPPAARQVSGSESCFSRVATGPSWVIETDVGAFLAVDPAARDVVVNDRLCTPGTLSGIDEVDTIGRGGAGVAWKGLQTVLAFTSRAHAAWELSPDSQGIDALIPTEDWDNASISLELIAHRAILQYRGLSRKALTGDGWTDGPEGSDGTYTGKADSTIRFSNGLTRTVWYLLFSEKLTAGDCLDAAERVRLVSPDGGEDHPLEVYCHPRERGYTFSVHRRVETLPMVVNGAPVDSAWCTDLDGGYVRVADQVLRLDPDTGEVFQSRILFGDLAIRSLCYSFADGKSAASDISFTVGQGEMVAVMGPSGSGKSTFIKLVLGFLKPTSGQVLLNGVDFHRNLSKIRPHLGFVPQDDLLYENLTVYENLYYAARFYYPSASQIELEERIDTTLRLVGLFERKFHRVGDAVDAVLSGGQRKRLNIALETIGNPALFFLDEPTSGLSSRDSEQILRTLKRQTHGGAIIFVVIHQPSSELFKLFDKVLILDVGGRQAFFGAPEESVAFFHGQAGGLEESGVCSTCRHLDTESIFSILEDYRAITQPSGKIERKRIISPEQWAERFRLYVKNRSYRKAELPGKELPDQPVRGVSASLIVLCAMIGRVLREKLKDRMQFVLIFLAPAGLGLIMAWLMRGGEIPYSYTRNTELSKFLFLSVIVFIFLGLMASIGEVIRDRAKLLRERLMNLGSGFYVVSKVIPYIVFNAVQVCSYTAISFFVLNVPSSLALNIGGLRLLPFWAYFIVVGMICSLTAFSLGLFFSSILKSQAAAFAVIPLVIIPQILFGGLFLDYGQMYRLPHEQVPWYANLTLSRWAYEALTAGEAEFNPIYQLTDSDGRLPGIIEYHREQGIPFRFLDVLGALKEEPILSELPPVMTRGVYLHIVDSDRIDEESRRMVERLYVRRDRGDRYRLTEDPSPVEKQAMLSILETLPPNGLFNRFTSLQANETIAQDYRPVRAEWYSEWDGLRRGERVASVTSRRLPSRNPFPATLKQFGLRLVPTVVYNLLVLAGMALLLIVFAVVRIKKIQG